MSNPSIAIEKQLYWHEKFMTYGHLSRDVEAALTVKQLDGAPHVRTFPLNDTSMNYQIDDSKGGIFKTSSTGLTEAEYDRIMGITTAAALEAGSAYYWAPEICDLMKDVATSIPVYTLTVDALPHQSAFFHFEKPIALSNGHTVAGLMWHIFDVEIDKEKVLADMGEEFDAKSLAFIEEFNADHKDGTVVFSTIEELQPDELLPSRGGIIWTIGHDSDAIMRPLIVAEEDEEHQASEEVKLIAACLSFIKQKILVSSAGFADRPTKRRNGWVPKDFWNNPAYVIQLRKKEYVGSHDKKDNETDIEWSCRWIVRGFWRQQWYATEEVHKPKWIEPFMKGPADKPLRIHRDTVRAVVR